MCCYGAFYGKRGSFIYPSPAVGTRKTFIITESMEITHSKGNLSPRKVIKCNQYRENEKEEKTLFYRKHSYQYVC